MTTDHRAELRTIRTFPQLVRYLRDEMGWPIGSDDFEDITFDYTPEELGIDPKSAAKIQEIKRLRPLTANQPWGIFFVKFEPKRLPIVALRRILNQVVVKKRASGSRAERAAWETDDLLFISNFGVGDERQICLAHFSYESVQEGLPSLKVLGWDSRDTPLHLDDVAVKLSAHLAWPSDESDVHAWRTSWRSAFTVRHREAITTSRDLSIHLAMLARAIRERIYTALSIETERGPLTKLMKSFQEALVHDLDVDGFADMYAQTIAYGLLSTRVVNPKGKATGQGSSLILIPNPFLRELLETFLHVGRGSSGARKSFSLDFDELGVSEIIELLNDANMEAVLRDFGDCNPQEDPVIHFYELFLKEYDPDKRIERGVFYTPRPVVSYIVRSVHALLQKEFDLEDGLADVASWGDMAKKHRWLNLPEGVNPTDRFVTILDPAAGTGTFLVETIEVIHETMTKKWESQGCSKNKIEDLWNEYVPSHLLPRLYGFELLMAPYAIAHLKIGLKLNETGYRFQGSELTQIYMTNSLEPAQPVQVNLSMPALAHESELVNAVKRRSRFNVVLGNPPYSKISSNWSNWITQLIDSYREVDGEPLKEKKLWIQDDYIKFIRFGQWSIDETGRGVLAFITNHGYLDNSSLRGMRQNLLKTFNRIHILNLHGNKNRREISPEGDDDDNVFDIRQGVSIGLFVKNPDRKDEQSILCADSWGTRELKYNFLNNHNLTNTSWNRIKPASPYYFYVPTDFRLKEEYDRGWAVPEIFPIYGSGFISARDQFVMDFDKKELVARIRDFFDRSQSDDEIRRKYGIRDYRGFVVSQIRKERKLSPNKIVECLYRPFDKRFLYYDRYIVQEWQYSTMKHMMQKNLALLCHKPQSPTLDFTFIFCTDTLGEQCSAGNKSVGAGITYLFPLYCYENGTRTPNISKPFIDDMTSALGLEPVKEGAGDLRNSLGPEDVLSYVYAILHCPTYRERYSEFLKIESPKIPILENLELFRSLVKMGGRLIDVHLLRGNASEKVKPDFPIEGKKTVQPGYPKYHEQESRVYLNPDQFIGKVPKDVWEFRVGGYQVCEKFLKDRRSRSLTHDDIVLYLRIIQAIVTTKGIMREIDGLISKWPVSERKKRTPQSRLDID